MTTDRELMQQALDAMLNFPNDISDEMFESIRSLRARLAQPERAWQGLTDEQIQQIEILTDEQIQQIEMSASSKLSAIYLADAQLKGKNG